MVVLEIHLINEQEKRLKAAAQALGLGLSEYMAQIVLPRATMRVEEDHPFFKLTVEEGD